MSPLTYWLAIGAIVLAATFVANALAYRRRFGTFLRVEQRSAVRRRALSRLELLMAGIFTFALLAGFATPTLVPESSFARWLLEPYSQLVYFAWCLLASMVAGAVRAVAARFSKETPK